MKAAAALKYCPRCGHQTEAKEHRRICANCEYTSYFDPKPTVTVALKNQTGRFLLVKRAIDPNKGKWDLPGGFVETSETFEEAAHREIREELGVEIEKLDYLMSAYDDYEFQGVTSSVLAVIFIAEIVGDTEPQPADDVASCAWYYPADFPYTDLAFPSLEPVLKRLA